MAEAKSKLYSVGEIALALFFCCLFSFFIYAVSVFYIFAAWHCPDGNCQTPTLVNAIVFLILASPFFIFPLGAYFARNAVYNLTESKIFRIIMLATFALFPLVGFAAMIAYIVNTN